MEYEINVSVIIPVYNAEKHIEKQLNAVVSQTLKKIEIIIVNDGSTDNTELIIKRFSKHDDKIILINQKNQKQGSARNNGYRNAKGEYIIFLDADDWIEKDFLEKMYIRAKIDNLDVVLCDTIWEKKNKVIKKTIQNVNENIIISGKVALEKLIKNEILIAPWNKLIRNQLIKKYNILFPEKLFYEDLEFAFKLFYYSNRISKEPLVYYHYQVLDGSSTKLYDISIMNSLSVLHNIMDFLISENIYDYYHKQYQALYLYHGVYSMILKSQFIKDEKTYRFIKKEINSLFSQNILKSWFKNEYIRIDKRLIILAWRINPQLIKVLKHFLVG